MGEALNAKQRRRIVEDAWDAYRRGENAPRAMERISRHYGVEPQVVVSLLIAEEMGEHLEEDGTSGGEPEKVLIIGHETAEGFQSLAIDNDEGLRELPVFTEAAKAGEALDELGYNPEMVRIQMPMHSLGALEVTLGEAVRMAGTLGCACVGIDFGFSEDEYRRILVSEASGEEE